MQRKRYGFQFSWLNKQVKVADLCAGPSGKLGANDEFMEDGTATPPPACIIQG